MLSILIVDDEKTVIQGLVHILKKHCPEYRIADTAQSAFEALRILEAAAVDVVITDVRMPGMDGIALTGEIRRLYPKTSVVVLSGYDDFEYVRQTMKNGAFDYLLKPCHYQTVLDILRKIEESITHDDKISQELQNKKILEEMLAGQRKMPDDWTSDSQLLMAVIATKDYRDPLCGEHLKKEFTDGQTAEGGVDLVELGDHHVVIFRTPQDLPLMKKRFVSYRQSMLHKGCRIYSAICGFTRSPCCLEQAYLSCVKMLDFLEFNELPAVLDTETYNIYMEQQKELKLHHYFSGQTLGKFIIGADMAKSRNYIQSSLNKLYRLDLYIDPIQLRQEILKELVYLERYLKDCGIDLEQLLKKKLDYVHQLARLKSLRSLLSWLKDFSMSILLNMSGEDQLPHYIHTAIHFIEKHYMEDISLKSISDQVYLNPWYFSTQFKKYLHVSFSEYLNQVRIRMAKEFLRQKDLKVYQVAEMVGFQDAAYFSTVFKNMEQISPKEFQKTIL